MFSILNRALSWAITSFGNKLRLKKRSRLIKALDNRFYVKFMQLEIGLFLAMFQSRSQILHCMKKLDYPCNCKSEAGYVCKPVEYHCLRAMKIVHHHANGRFDRLIFGHQSVNPSREVISILSDKYKRFTFAHTVTLLNQQSRKLGTVGDFR